MRHTEDASIRRPRMTPDRELDLLTTAKDALREVGYQDLSADGLLADQADKDAALSHAVLADEELASAVRTTLVEPWFADLIGVVDRAVERCELLSLGRGKETPPRPRPY